MGNIVPRLRIESFLGDGRDRRRWFLLVSCLNGDDLVLRRLFRADFRLGRFSQADPERLEARSHAFVIAIPFAWADVAILRTAGLAVLGVGVSLLLLAPWVVSLIGASELRSLWKVPSARRSQPRVMPPTVPLTVRSHSFAVLG